MKQEGSTPTAQNYTELQRAYDHFNQALFESALPACLITLQREKRTCGNFSHQRFADLDGRTTDEIALNYAGRDRGESPFGACGWTTYSSETGRLNENQRSTARFF